MEVENCGSLDLTVHSIRLLNQLMQQRKPVQLKDCQIQPGKRDSSQTRSKIEGHNKVCGISEEV